MNDAETTTLYVLSTLAQTCAALAAFVGAVGIYRLQLLRDDQTTAERNVRGLAAAASLVGTDVAALVPFDEVIDAVRRTEPTEGAQRLRASARQALAIWYARARPIARSRTALLIFEAWNLLVILVSLVGFNYVSLLASSPACALWGAAIGTVAVSGYCVYAWTRSARRGIVKYKGSLIDVQSYKSDGDRWCPKAVVSTTEGGRPYADLVAPPDVMFDSKQEADAWAVEKAKKRFDKRG